jgi:hypothetical protein
MEDHYNLKFKYVSFHIHTISVQQELKTEEVYLVVWFFFS